MDFIWHVLFRNTLRTEPWNSLFLRSTTGASSQSSTRSFSQTNDFSAFQKAPVLFQCSKTIWRKKTRNLQINFHLKFQEISPLHVVLQASSISQTPRKNTPFFWWILVALKFRIVIHAANSLRIVVLQPALRTAL